MYFKFMSEVFRFYKDQLNVYRWGQLVLFLFKSSHKDMIIDVREGEREREGERDTLM